MRSGIFQEDIAGGGDYQTLVGDIDGVVGDAISEKILAFAVRARRGINVESTSQATLMRAVSWFQVRFVVTGGHCLFVTVDCLVGYAEFHGEGSVPISC